MKVPGEIKMVVFAQATTLEHAVLSRVYIVVFPSYISGGSSVSQNKLPQLILGYIYILKYLQSNFIG